MCKKTRQFGSNVSPMAHRSAFTLVELLVVVGVITALVAVLLPAMSRARTNSRRLSCQANLRNLAAAWDLYVDQNDGHYYQWISAQINYGGRQGRGSPSYRVSKPLNAVLNMPTVMQDGGDVFRCPADTGVATIRPSCFQWYGTSYITNIMLIGQNQLQLLPNDPCKSVFQKVNGRIKNLTRSKVSGDNSKIVLMGDAGWFSAWNLGDAVYESDGTTQRPRADWHGKSWTHNLVFLDGHATFTRIHKGMNVTDNYNVIPFADLVGMTADLQKEIATP